MSLNWDELDAIGPPQARRWRHPFPPTCPRCAYNLTGLPSDRCPECGTSIHWRAVHLEAVRLMAVLRRLEHANEEARRGLWVVLGSWAAVLLGWLADLGPLGTLIDLAAAAAAIAGVVLGSRALSVRKLPPHVRALLSADPPNVALGAAVTTLGILLFVAALALMLA